MNTQTHEATKHTPYELVFGQPPRSILVPDAGFRGQLAEKVLHSTEEVDTYDEDSDQTNVVTISSQMNESYS